MSEGKLLLDHDLAEVWLGADGVLEFRYKPGVTVEGDGAAEVIAQTIAELGDRGPRPTLVFVGDVHKVTRAAREFFARDPENARVSSQLALIGTSAIGRMVANFFLGLNRPDNLPVRLFASEADARTWLSGSD